MAATAVGLWHEVGGLQAVEFSRFEKVVGTDRDIEGFNSVGVEISKT